MQIRLAFLILSFIYTILIWCVYYSKKRISNAENKIYEKMLFTTPLGLLLEFGCNMTAIFLPESLVALVVSKLYLVFIIVWLSMFTLYITSVTILKGKSLQTYYKSILRKTIIILSVIFSILCLVLPFEFNLIGEQAYLSGIGVYVLIISVVMLLLYDFICYFIYFKKINIKERLPMIILMFIIVILVLLNKFAPEIQIVSTSFAFITILMYHTIENPDIKMVRELEYAKNTAEKANRAKSDFLSSMSHEIRTPLNAIVGLSECIKNSDNIEEIHEDANDVVMASQNLLEIVNGILDISKIEADKMEIVETNYNPIEVFKEVATIAETRIGEKEIELKCHYAEDIPDTLYGDKGKLKQIITNVLSNAVKYTEKGHIKFNVSCINERDKSKLQIIISDTGRGIKPDQIDKIFNKFERAEEDKNSTIEGTGLGLAITKSLVEMMGGKILVHSTYGEGSKFTIFLEQKYSKSESNTTVVKDEKVSYSDKRVLVVDDNKLNIKVASKVLSEFELNIDSCDSGFSAIEKIENNEHYDIIFMDIMMPKMSGVETLKKLKEIDNFNAPVVALTADAMEGKSTKYIEVGFNDYLSKPINKEELKRVLNKCLNENVEIEEEKTSEDDPHIHRVIPITDEQIEELNRLVAEKDKAEKEKNKNNTDYLKSNGVDIDSALELLGDEEMYNETLRTFVEENKTRIPNLKKYKESGDMKNYSIQVHALKSDCKYLGFKELAELSYQHEIKSKEEDIEYINENFDKLIRVYNKISNIINTYL